MKSIVRITAIAGNTIREAIRNRVLYTLLAFAVVIIGAGIVLSQLSYVEEDRILQSLGFSAMRLFGVAIALSLGVGLIHKEVERRTIYTTLSKPVGRTEFLIGKYAGLVATIWIQLGIMSAAFTAVCFIGGTGMGSAHLMAIGMLAVELAVVVALATLFSSFTTPMLAALFSSGIYVAGYLTRDLVALGAQTQVQEIIHFTRGVYLVLPDMESFNLTLQAVHGLPIASGEMLTSLGYGIAYSISLLLLASVIFERRDFR